MTDFRALCVELTDCLEKADWPHRYKAVFQQWVDISHAALVRPQPKRPTVDQLEEFCLWWWGLDNDERTVDDVIEGGSMAAFAEAVFARWGNHPESPDSSDGPAVPDDREPASVTEQLKYQLFNAAKADLIRQVMDRALRDTAPYHWRETEGGEQLVRVRDLLTWAEQTAAEMEQLDD